MLLSAILKKMPLSAKERREIVKISYLHGQNSVLTLRVYCRNYGLWCGPCTVKAVQDLIYKFQETGCMCDRPQSGGPSLPVETVAKVHQTISTVCPASAHSVSCVLHLPNSTVCKNLCSVLNKLPFLISACPDVGS